MRLRNWLSVLRKTSFEIARQGQALPGRFERRTHADDACAAYDCYNGDKSMTMGETDEAAGVTTALAKKRRGYQKRYSIQ